MHATLNASQSMNERFGGMMIDLSHGAAQASHSIRLSRDPSSKEIDESDPQHEKHHEQRISTFRGIMID
jgi:hypothetical protein